MTVLDLIKRSMRLLGAINIGDNPTADESADAFMALNAMADAWGTERLTMFTTARTVYGVTAGIQQYALGPNTTGTDWTGPRPPYLDGAGIIIAASPAAYERPLYIIETDEEWQRERVKTLQGTLPTKLYYQPDFPNGTITLWPAPIAALQVALYTPTAVSQFTSLTQTISLPPGYARALAYNLAIEMAPEFDREPSAVVVAIADASKLSLKRANVPGAMGRLRVDPAVRGRGGNFDIYLGDWR